MATHITIKSAMNPEMALRAGGMGAGQSEQNNLIGNAAHPYQHVDEHADYLNVNSEQLYYVLHRPLSPPLGFVLQAGHFASERSHAYLAWVRWSRYLAAHGFVAMHFDYRGVGESTGAFEAQGFESWVSDIRELAKFLRQEANGMPLIFHGVGLGALLAPRVFDEGLGAAMLGWSPPESGRTFLYETLRLRMASDFALKPHEKRRTRDDYVKELEAGKLVEVEGYLWSEKLWRQADAIPKPQYESTQEDPRPRLALDLDRRAGDLLPLSARITMPTGGSRGMRSYVETPSLNADMSFLFEPACAWMKEVVAKATAVKQ